MWGLGVFVCVTYGALYGQADTTSSTPSTSATSTGAESALVSAGEALFKGNCTICHGIDERVIGPPLRDVHKRRPVEWMKRFIKNSEQVIQSGDAYAVNLYKEYGQTQMTAFDFSEQELDAVVAYIVRESEKPPAAAAAAAGGEGAVAVAGGLSSTHILLIGLGFLVILVLIVVVLGLFMAMLKREGQRAGKASEEVFSPTIDLKKVVKGNTFLFLFIFLFTAVVLKAGIDALYGVGIQQHYQPEQPIAFSHKIHAGDFQIDCNYCHTGVYKSKSANIPSANICMNCHSEIQKDSPEIQKIYTAVRTGRPIEWVRVHNLPDLSYFNHAQHTSVGKIACQTCHGPIEEMDVVYQHAALTMGWCINCHQETEVQVADNAYYKGFAELHGEEAPVHVMDIGGLECSKCHY